MVRIHLGGGDIGFGDGSQLGSQVITLGFGTAGDTDVGEHLADLAAFLDGDRGDAAAADDQNSTHILSTPFRFFEKKLGKKLLYSAARPLRQRRIYFLFLIDLLSR
jgi:hypothetical protein